MQISLQNIGSILDGEISIEEGYFNIKYAMNGTGKSSFANYLKAHIDHDDETMSKYVPFGTNETPSISFSSQKPNSCIVFNEEYIKNYLFRPDDILNESMRLIRLTPEVRSAINEYESALSGLRATANARALAELINRLTDIKSTIKQTKNGSISGNSKFGKATKGGCNVLHADAGSSASIFNEHIEAEYAPSWHAWHVSGRPWVNHFCPFCGQQLPANFDLVKNDLDVIFGRSDAKANVEIRRKISDVSSLLASHSGIDALLSTTSTPTEMQYRAAMSDIDRLRSIAQSVQTASELSPLDLRHINSTDFRSKIENMRLDISWVAGADYIDACAAFNLQIDALAKASSELQQKVQDCDAKLSKTISRFKAYVNDYLTRCGIPYRFEIDQKDMNHVYTKLVKVFPAGGSFDVPTDALSYGEKNCLCLSLFVLDACQNNSELIILDDPVSSFDSGKRFAMFFSIFHDKRFSLKGKTILLFTHDITPLIDFIKRTSAGVGNLAKGWFLRNIDGHLVEREIRPEDIESTLIIEKNLSCDKTKSIVTRLIHARRYFEISGTYGPVYNLISSLLHGQPVPTEKIGEGNDRPLSPSETSQAQADLKTLFITDDYSSLLNQVCDTKLCSLYTASADSYEKMAISRILFDRHHKKLDTITSYTLNAVFHIEQSVLFNCVFLAEESIPSHVAELVDKETQKLISVINDAVSPS